MRVWWRNICFLHFLFARHATDVRLQQENHSLGNLEESKAYFSANHSLYGYRTAVSVFPIGMCFRSSEHKPGRVVEINICRSDIEFHTHPMRKYNNEEDLANQGEHIGRYLSLWALLVDKGYQRVLRDFRAVHPTKSKAIKTLTYNEKKRTDDICSDIVIVENYFRREVILWKVMQSTSTWSERTYTMVSQLVRSITNYQVKLQSIRNRDSAYFNAYSRRLYNDRVLRAQKRGAHQQASRRSRNARL